jgi:3-deoxy-manno-octulosonate cytidylyltransferase (CMP-KDO synthetase)
MTRVDPSARLGSTRLPNKVLAEIAGRPMIAHVLDRARESGLGPVAVACGEQAIADAVRAAGGTAVMTDPDLPSGSDRIFAALNLVDPAGEHDTIINLQGDLPGINPDYLASVLLPLASYEIATLVAPITTREEAAAHSVVKCACAFAEGQEVAPALYFSRNIVPSGAGPLWHHIGIYAYRREALARLSSARSWSSCGGWRPACASARRGWRWRRLGWIRRRIWRWRGRSSGPAHETHPGAKVFCRAFFQKSACFLGILNESYRLSGPARRLLRPGLPQRLSGSDHAALRDVRGGD